MFVCGQDQAEKELPGAKRPQAGGEATKEETNNNVAGRKEETPAKKETLAEGPSLTKPPDKVATLLTKPSVVKPADKSADTSPAMSPDVKPSPPTAKLDTAKVLVSPPTAKVDTAKVLTPPPKPGAGGDSGGSSPKPTPRALLAPRKPAVDVTAPSPPSAASDAGDRKSASDSSGMCQCFNTFWGVILQAFGN